MSTIKNSPIASFTAGTEITNPRIKNKTKISTAALNKPKSAPKNLSTCLITGIEVIIFANTLSRTKSNIEPKKRVTKAISKRIKEVIRGETESIKD